MQKISYMSTLSFSHTTSPEPPAFELTTTVSPMTSCLLRPTFTSSITITRVSTNSMQVEYAYFTPMDTKIYKFVLQIELENSRTTHVRVL